MHEVLRETGLPAALRSLRPNLLDRAISYFDPVKGLERYRARAMQLGKRGERWRYNYNPPRRPT